MEKLNLKLIIRIVIGVVAFFILLYFNPFGYNEPTDRTVVTKFSGEQKCVFEPGPYWAGFLAREEEYPNQISIQYKADEEDLELKDNTVDIGRASVQFLGGASAVVTGIAQFSLPNDDSSMIEIHNTHRNILGLVKRRLAPYTQECLSSSAQLLTPETHYNGGKAQMSQNYLDQLKEGSYLLEIDKVVTYDSTEKSRNIEYTVRQQKDKQGNLKRKFSSIKEYNIRVGDAQITLVDYENRIDSMLGKQIDAATKASISRQALMTARQEALTAAAKGQQKLVETEYQQKIALTTQTVQAQTKVELARLYKSEQAEAADAAVFAAKKIRTDADANAYQNRQLRDAGLTAYEKADFEMKTKIGIAEHLAKIELPSTYIVGGSGGSRESLIDALLATKLITEK